MTKQTKTFASRCKACNRTLDTFTHSKTLPDGSVDDLCTSCKDAIYASFGVRFTDYFHEHVVEDVTLPDDEDIY